MIMNKVQAKVVESLVVDVDFTIREIDGGLDDFHSVEFDTYGSKDSLKAVIIRILALQEILKEQGFYISYGPTFTFAEEFMIHCAETGREEWVTESEIKVRPYYIHDDDEEDAELIAVTYDCYLDSLPRGLGEIIKEIEADRENLVKKCAFEMKLQGIEVNTMEDICGEGFVRHLKKEVEDNER